MTNTTTDTATKITLRGKTGWKTLGNSIKATIGVTSTTLQTAGHAYTKVLEVGLDAVPGEAGVLIAGNATKKGLKGLVSSVKSNEPTEAAINSIYYAKENFMGNTAYVTWAQELSKEDTADLEEALDAGLKGKDIEEALENGGPDKAMELVAATIA